MFVQIYIFMDYDLFYALNVITSTIYTFHDEKDLMLPWKLHWKHEKAELQWASQYFAKYTVGYTTFFYSHELRMLELNVVKRIGVLHRERKSLITRNGRCVRLFYKDNLLIEGLTGSFNVS